MPAQTAFVQLAEPIRCTRRTNSKSAISILAKVLSRSTPALLTRMSTWPHNLSARATIAETSSKSATSAGSAIAVPPLARISSTTLMALSKEAPARSLTTTFAPRAASPRACERPRPEPAPVTIALLPSNSILMIFPVQAPHSTRRCFRERLVRATPSLQHRAVRLRHEAPKPQSDCAPFGLREYAARNQPIAVRHAPKAIERRPHDIVAVNEGRLKTRLVARFFKGAKVGTAVPIDGRIMVANHRHELIGVAEHVLDRGGCQRVSRLPIVPLKGVELP